MAMREFRVTVPVTVTVFADPRALSTGAIEDEGLEQLRELMGNLIATGVELPADTWGCDVEEAD